MNIYFRCLESRIDKNNTLYGKFNFTSIPSGQGNTFANALRRSLFSDLSGLAITHFCITSNPGLGYEFATIPGLAESVLDFSLNLKKVVLTGRLTGALSTGYKMDKDTSLQLPEYQNPTIFGYPSLSCPRFPLVNPNPKLGSIEKAFGLQAEKRGTICFANPISKSNTPRVTKGLKYAIQGLSKENPGHRITGGNFLKSEAKKAFGCKVLYQENVIKKNSSLGSPVKESKKYNVQNFSPLAPIGFLKAKGPTILRACDLVLPPGIRCVHPDQYLGTLAADSALSIKFLIAAGKGYIVQDETFYKSLSRAKLLLASRSSKSPVFSTSCVSKMAKQVKQVMQAKDSYPVKNKYYTEPNAFLSSLKTVRSLSYLQLPDSLSSISAKVIRLGTSNLSCAIRCETKDKHPMVGTSTKKGKTLDLGKKVKNLRYRCLGHINEPRETILTPHESELPSAGIAKSAFGEILSQKSINQEQSLARLNDNEKLSRKQLFWGAQDKLHPVLPLDATFTPTSKVNFQIDIDRNTEKSEETIVFEIWTNGSITPKRAIQESCLALAQDFYSLFSSVNGFSNLHSWWKRESLQFYPMHLS